MVLKGMEKNGKKNVVLNFFSPSLLMSTHCSDGKRWLVDVLHASMAWWPDGNNERICQKQGKEHTNASTWSLSVISRALAQSHHEYKKSWIFYSQTEHEEVQKTFEAWKETGVIVEAPIGCPYNNSLTISARRDLEGAILKHRICLDTRTLNRQLLETDTFPLHEFLMCKIDALDQSTAFDLSQACHRMPIDPASQPLTAFTYCKKQWVFARAPYGLKPLMSILQRGMLILLGDLLYCEAYVDDIFVHSADTEGHITHATVVITRLISVGLITNRAKCNFMSTENILLGVTINRAGKKIDRNKIANV